MKKLTLVLAIAVLLFGGRAYAEQCNDSRLVGGASDDCWRFVTVASNEANVVSQGTVLIWDITNPEFSTARASYQVRVSSATTSHLVAGVAQTTIASGQSGLILSKGKGKVHVTGAVVSGNALYTSISTGRATPGANTTNSGIGFALATCATGTDCDAYINV